MGGLPWWAAVIVISVVFAGAFVGFYLYFMSYIEGAFPDSDWIQAEIYTAYWFGILMLCLLIRYLMMDLN